MDSVTGGRSIRKELAESLPSTFCDAIQIEQVLLNLVCNGMEAMSSMPLDEREITIITSQSDNGMIQVAVKDKGIGIEAELLSEIFKPFYTTKPHGMGLGLSISRTIIEAHQGELWAIQNPDGGLTICFTVSPFTKASSTLENPADL